jgi:hypothetical protein
VLDSRSADVRSAGATLVPFSKWSDAGIPWASGDKIRWVIDARHMTPVGGVGLSLYLGLRHKGF